MSALVQSADGIFEERREFAVRRQAIIAASLELRERELIKLATLASQLADTLRQRGETGTTASLAGEAGVAVFTVAFQRWVDDTGEATLSHFIEAYADELRATTTRQGGPPPR